MVSCTLAETCHALEFCNMQQDTWVTSDSRREADEFCAPPAYSLPTFRGQHIGPIFKGQEIQEKKDLLTFWRRDWYVVPKRQKGITSIRCVICRLWKTALHPLLCVSTFQRDVSSDVFRSVAVIMRHLLPCPLDAIWMSLSWAMCCALHVLAVPLPTKNAMLD